MHSPAQMHHWVPTHESKHYACISHRGSLSADDARARPHGIVHYRQPHRGRCLLCAFHCRCSSAALLRNLRALCDDERPALAVDAEG